MGKGQHHLPTRRSGPPRCWPTTVPAPRGGEAGKLGPLNMPEQVVGQRVHDDGGAQVQLLARHRDLREGYPGALPRGRRALLHLGGRPETSDADFTWSEFVRHNNEELAASWGNLVNRVANLMHKNLRRDPCAGRIEDDRRGPCPAGGDPDRVRHSRALIDGNVGGGARPRPWAWRPDCMIRRPTNCRISMDTDHLGTGGWARWPSLRRMPPAGPAPAHSVRWCGRGWADTGVWSAAAIGGEDPAPVTWRVPGRYRRGTVRIRGPGADACPAPRWPSRRRSCEDSGGGRPRWCWIAWMRAGRPVIRELANIMKHANPAAGYVVAVTAGLDKVCVSCADVPQRDVGGNDVAKVVRSWRSGAGPFGRAIFGG